jgi:hypothetical protein
MDTLLKEALLKQAAGPMLEPAAFDMLLRVGMPTAMASMAGIGAGIASAPAPDELKALQARFVRSRLEEALSDLEREKRLAMLKERFIGQGPSIRL